MPRWLLPMFLCVVVIPIVVTGMQMFLDGGGKDLSSYLPGLLGYATGGLVVGFVLFQIRKLND